jgi:hypothetical protein
MGVTRRLDPPKSGCERRDKQVGKEKKGHGRLGRGRDARIKRWIKFASAFLRSSWTETTIKKICFDLLLDRINNLESKKLGLAEERAEFAERHV